MSGAALVELEKLLKREAHKLTGDSLLPVDVERVAKELGLSMRCEERSGRVQHGALRLDETGTWEVVLYRHRDAGPFSNRERFSLAHEIAHFLVEKRLPNARPRRDSEYWSLERCCDVFASHLLLPERELRARLADRPSEPLGLIRTLMSLSGDASVSLHATARRLAGGIPASSFCLLEESADPKTGRRGSVVWRVESGVGFSPRKAKHIYADDELAAILSGHAETHPGQSIQSTLAAKLVASRRLGRRTVLIAGLAPEQPASDSLPQPGGPTATHGSG